MAPQTNEPIAVIGSACRFAGDVNSPSKLAKLIENPRKLRQEIPKDRFSVDGFYHPNGSYHGHTNVRHAYFLEEDVAAFDAEFFGIKPVEAKAIDPQQRILMEVAYEALESAGLPVQELRGSDTAVYVGCMVGDYMTMLLRDLQEIPTYTATGTGASVLSNRLSYFFDWHGPSVTLDTACSSSLAAVHLAAQSLRSGDSRVALASGSNLILGPENFVMESKLKMLSPDGVSRMWDEGANGYARGEGVATLVLKTLSAALEDGDHIECLVRETALNQDGASAGITMPSASAQEALIRKVYAKAGLDVHEARDRPQYFEAHGTGTPAGDPQEAEAIYNAFHDSSAGASQPGTRKPMYVGSIKTVLGHTEGTAGIAGILKASVAMQQGFIPPNLHFDQLSERVAPFYKDVEIVKAAMPWPQGEDTPKRASINSFGFGGTNAHAIIESYTKPNTDVNASAAGNATFAPFVFSAFSEQSLRSTLSAYLEYLDNDKEGINARDLSWTLRERRTAFRHRTSYAASNLDELKASIKASVEDVNSSLGVKALQATKETPKTLGVFTGQGAQYARMAAELIVKSETARRIIEDLEASLAQLPDGPTWSLKSELLADDSRIHEAAISQPLCTAVQILLVRLLELAGIQLNVVVGHSSGEIAAAYSAGYLTAHDAIRIAYYRGYHLKVAASPNGKDIKGAMLAVGSSVEDMREICADSEFSGRVCIAASNSSSSVTMSGDEDAIQELQAILDDEKKFNRRLKVDKAYHSNHMLPCSDAYIASLRSCGVTTQKPRESCVWVSSVYNRPASTDMALGDEYWAANMTQPVLFAEALHTALSNNTCDLALEVGPHPALKGPATQNIQSALNKDLPYTGVLNRGAEAVQAFSTALGFVWSYLGSAFVNIDAYENTMVGDKHQYQVLKSLPTYRWAHGIRHWHESRSSRKLRLRTRPVHSLLGDISPESAPHHLVWKNLLQVSEMEWLLGHKVQSQTVFPASGYLTSALEASRVLAEESKQEIRLIELKNFTIHQAVAFSDDDIGIEVSIEMSEILTDAQRIRAKFSYSAALSPQAEDLILAADCEVEITLGEPSQSLLPTRQPELTHVIDVETERFYAALADLGYNFSDRFRSLSSLQRKYQRATCLAKMRPLEADEDALLIHPAELDSVLQSIILSYSYPYDEQLRTLHLPTSIRHIRVNPALLGATNRTEDEYLAVDSRIDPKRPEQRGITGHVDMYAHASSHAAIQVQGANFRPLGGDEAGEDRRVFSKVSWVNSKADGDDAARDIPLGGPHIEMVKLLERIATFYLRQFEKDIPPDSPLRSEFPTNWYLNYANYVTDMVETGKHKWAKKEWLDDTVEDIIEAGRPYASTPDVEIMHLVGNQMPRVFRGETTILEEFRANDVLDRYYATGFGLRESGKWVSRTVKQIVDRYPHMNILEVGAGTGGATKSIFREIGSRFDTYTYTDISAAFFEKAAANFPQHQERMVFKTFNAENSPTEQGFTEGSYDLVVAFFVIHACSDLEKALRHIRRLLKPGGHLVVGEGQEGQNGVASSGFIFGTLPGWWLGTDTGRVLSPHVSPQEWDELLRKTGFSGVDSATPPGFEDILNVYHFSSQAVDNRVDLFRNPISSALAPQFAIDNLVIIGGETYRSSRLVDGIKSVFEGGLAKSLQTFKTLETADYDAIGTESTVISLTELDHPVFKDITSNAFEALKNMFGTKKTLLWVTSGRLDDEPYSNMTVGFGRTAQHETPDLLLQQLDIEDPATVDPQAVAEIVLRLHAAVFEKSGTHANPEPEILINKQGKHLVPRLRPIPELNDRYNSGRRTLLRERTISEKPFVVEPSSAGCAIRDLLPYADAVSDRKVAECVSIDTTDSVHFAIKTLLGHKFLTRGVLSDGGAPYMALLPSLKSKAMVPIESAVPCPDIDGISTADLISATAAQLIAAAVTDGLHDGQVLLVHNASPTVGRVIETVAASKNIQTIFATDRANKNTPKSWIQLPRYLSRAELDDTLALKPSAFVGLTDQAGEPSENEAILTSIIPEHCLELTARDIFSASAVLTGTSCDAKLGELLRTAIRCAKAEFNAQDAAQPSSTTVTLSALAKNGEAANPLSVVQWADSDTLPVSIARLDSKQMFKSTNSTYWIVGMTAALGISLADWMVKAGARNVVLTSRKPNISPEWVESHRRKGATVTVLPCDVTDENALKQAHRTICDTLPPIAGVMNGAMVLRDISILNMSFDDLITVLRPKVNGSIYLDRIFHDIDLDFFVLVSSINCVVGNLGQANYAAANTFMCALAAQRRKRGLRAATVNGGAIIGAGYMERESRRALDLIVQKLNMMRLSEEDWCQTICEAIDASRLESSVGAELTTGLSDVPFDTPNAPYWFLNPKFSDFLYHQPASKSEGSKGSAAVSVKERISNCASQDELLEVVEECFANQLRNVLQTSVTTADLMASTGTDIGLDSLVSVDIRSWFLKNLQVNIPVLKIMSNDSVGTLAQYAVENIPADLAPLLHSSRDDSDTEASASGREAEASSILANSSTNTQVSTAITTPARTPSPDSKSSRKIQPGEVDWYAESSLPADLPLASHTQGPTPVNPPNNVILTGVSGLLGHHLLNNLLEQPSTKKVVCIAVRRLSERLAKGELPRHPSVEYYEGDLALPMLGLSPEHAESIFAEADVVIHNGADTSHLKYFRDLRIANVGSTLDLIRLCLPRRIPIQYISSAGVAVLYNQPNFPPVSVTGPGSMLPAPDGTFGYMCSKWVNERLLEQVHQSHGLHVGIHRPSTIVREGADAASGRAEFDWVHALLNYSRKIKAVPKIEHNLGALDLVYVRTACDDILAAINDTSERAKKEVTYVHEVGDTVLPMNHLEELGKETGAPFDVLPFTQWIEKAVGAGLHPAVGSLIEMMDSPGAPNYPRLRKTIDFAN